MTKHQSSSVSRTKLEADTTSPTWEHVLYRCNDCTIAEISLILVLLCIRLTFLFLGYPHLVTAFYGCLILCPLETKIWLHNRYLDLYKKLQQPSTDDVAHKSIHGILKAGTADWDKTQQKGTVDKASETDISAYQLASTSTTCQTSHTLEPNIATKYSFSTSQTEPNVEAVSPFTDNEYRFHRLYIGSRINYVLELHFIMWIFGADLLVGCIALYAYSLCASIWVTQHHLHLQAVLQQGSNDGWFHKIIQRIGKVVAPAWSTAQQKMSLDNASEMSTLLMMIEHQRRDGSFHEQMQKIREEAISAREKAQKNGSWARLSIRFVMEHSIIRQLFHLVKSYKAKWNLPSPSRKANAATSCTMARRIIAAIPCGLYTCCAVYFIIAAIVIHFLAMTDVFIDRYIQLFHKDSDTSTKTAVKMLLWVMYILFYGCVGACMPRALVWLHNHQPELFKMPQPGNKEEAAVKEDSLVSEGTPPTVAAHAEDDYATKKKVELRGQGFTDCSCGGLVLKDENGKVVSRYFMEG
ncbi:MAG: hypothetical protein Q9201_005134 [Fulgogasparrea decipioides]